MIRFLVKKCIPNYEDVENKDVRERYGVLGGVLGIICNCVLFVIKLAIGSVMNSIAIISDAFNNLSDMGSSLVTIIGTKLSNQRPDKEHPFGHGRIEYISSLIVSFMIIIVGVELFRSSLDKIFHPEPVIFSPVLMVILVLSILVKIWMFLYNRYLGGQINSSILSATARDSLNDVITTSAVILATFIGKYLAFPVDGIIGLAVSIFIMYSGFGIAKDTIGMLLGTPPSHELVKKISDMILEGEGIVGVHDLIVHDYGPGRVMASVHAEVPDNINIVKIHEVIDAVEQAIYKELGIHIVIHMDPISVQCERTDHMRNLVNEMVKEVNSAYSIHDFRMTDGENNINLIFDMAVPCETSLEDRKAAVAQINRKLQQADPRVHTVIQIDDLF